MLHEAAWDVIELVENNLPANYWHWYSTIVFGLSRINWLKRPLASPCVSIRTVFKIIIVWLKNGIKSCLWFWKLAKSAACGMQSVCVWQCAALNFDSFYVAVFFFHFFLDCFCFFLPFLSNTAENVVILRSLRFVSFLIYSMAGSMWVHPLLVCECHSFAHMPQCTTTTTWAKVLGHIKTKTKAQAEADQVTFLLTLLQLQRKVENRKKNGTKKFLGQKN